MAQEQGSGAQAWCLAGWARNALHPKHASQPLSAVAIQCPQQQQRLRASGCHAPLHGVADHVDLHPARRASIHCLLQVALRARGLGGAQSGCRIQCKYQTCPDCAGNWYCVRQDTRQLPAPPAILGRGMHKRALNRRYRHCPLARLDACSKVLEHGGAAGEGDVGVQAAPAVNGARLHAAVDDLRQWRAPVWGEDGQSGGAFSSSQQ